MIFFFFGNPGVIVPVVDINSRRDNATQADRVGERGPTTRMMGF